MPEFEKYAPTDEEVVDRVCAGYKSTWELADRFRLWDDLRFWFHGAYMAMIACGRKEAELDFLFLRDHCAFRDAELAIKRREAEHDAG